MNTVQTLWIVALLLVQGLVLPCSQVLALELPAPGSMVRLSRAFNPMILKGFKINPRDPFRVEFIIDANGEDIQHAGGLRRQKIKEESERLIKYFLAAVTVPDDDLWVNLSPYEKDRVIPQGFGLTEMGRDLLAQDYLLKQVTATLMGPEDAVGKEFWSQIYAQAAKKFNSTDIPVSSFNKVWIVPEKADVYENDKTKTVFIVNARLKVMLEQDYLASKKHQTGFKVKSLQEKERAAFVSQMIRKTLVPQLTKEVNGGENFAKLRQVYHSVILGAWYKKKIEKGILGLVYKDKNKTKGVDIHDPRERERIYQHYVTSFKKGVYNYIKEDDDPLTHEKMARKYFMGGIQLNPAGKLRPVGSNAMAAALRRRNLLKLAAVFFPLEARPSAPETTGSLDVEVTSMLRRQAFSLEEYKVFAGESPFSWLSLNTFPDQRINIPRDITLEGILSKLQSGEFKDELLPGFARRFRDASYFLARRYAVSTTAEQRFAIDFFKRLGMELSKSPGLSVTPASTIDDPNYAKHIQEWLGLDEKIREDEIPDLMLTAGEKFKLDIVIALEQAILQQGYKRLFDQLKGKWLEENFAAWLANLDRQLPKSQTGAKNVPLEVIAFEAVPNKILQTRAVNCVGIGLLISQYFKRLGFKDYWSFMFKLDDIMHVGMILLNKDLKWGFSYIIWDFNTRSLDKPLPSLGLAKGNEIPAEGGFIEFKANLGQRIGSATIDRRDLEAWVIPGDIGLAQTYYKNLGVVVEKKMGKTAARWYFFKGLEVSPLVVDPNIYRGIVREWELMEKPVDDPRSLKLLEVSLRNLLIWCYPDERAGNYNLLGQVLQAQNKIVEAVAAYTEARKLDPRIKIDPKFVMRSPSDSAMNGGVDLTSLNDIASNGTIQFHFEPAMLNNFKDFIGFRPEVYRISSIPDVVSFLDGSNVVNKSGLSRILGPAITMMDLPQKK